MKLRMKGNSIRLRLTQSEVARLAEGGVVEEFCDFGGGRRFRYALEASATVSAVSAALDACNITIKAPSSAVRHWADSDETGIYGDSGQIAIAVEKDFRCLSHGNEAEEADSFPNPADCATPAI